MQSIHCYLFTVSTKVDGDFLSTSIKPTSAWRINSFPNASYQQFNDICLVLSYIVLVASDQHKVLLDLYVLLILGIRLNYHIILLVATNNKGCDHHNRPVKMATPK